MDIRPCDVNNLYNNCREKAKLLLQGLVCLCGSPRGISIKLKLLHYHLKVPTPSMEKLLSGAILD